MTAGAFLTCDPMVRAFGLHEIKNKAEAARRVWPNAIPKGKEKIGFYEAAYLIYVLASTDKIRDIHDREIAKRIWSASRSYYEELQANIVTFIGDLIHGRGSHDKTGSISHLEISKRTGITNVVLPGSRNVLFVPDLKGEVPTFDVEEYTFLRREFFKELGTLFRE